MIHFQWVMTRNAKNGQDLENPLFRDAAIFVALIPRDLGLMDAQALCEVFCVKPLAMRRAISK